MLYIIFTTILLFASTNNANITCYQNNEASEPIINIDFSTDIKEGNLERKKIFEDAVYSLAYLPYKENNFKDWSLKFTDNINILTYEKIFNSNTSKETFNFSDLDCTIKHNTNNRIGFLAYLLKYNIKLLSSNFINYQDTKSNPIIISNNNIEIKNIKDETYCELLIESPKEAVASIIKNNFVTPNSIYSFNIIESSIFYLKNINTFVTNLQFAAFDYIKGRISCYSKNLPTTKEEFKVHSDKYIELFKPENTL